ncbi:hypothetical protein LY76DRAFT_527686 [Colletotrichum caudatum]|nr:hypothetical protein LY76DRAFT_527686 [Colletotrichum caudatum]
MYCYLLQYGINFLQAATSDLSWTAVAEDLRSVYRVQSVSKEVSAHMLSTHSSASKDHVKRFIVRLKRLGLDETSSPAEYDLLLQNENSYIMGAVFRKVYLWRDGWVPPSSATGCKMGVSRRWATESVVVKKETLTGATGISDGKVIWLSSAVGGLIQGKLH